jgi:Xaa-Pro dipeptidase
MKRMADAIIGGLNGVIAALKPGITSGDADRACRSVIARAGYGDRFVHRTAYGVGIGFPPNWSEGKTLALRKDDPTVLEPNMTFHIVPSIFGGAYGLCFSETVLITAMGCEVITQYPREFFAL